MPATFDSTRIAALTGGFAQGIGPAGPITANSQTMSSGEWFVALAGPGFDDHAFIPQAAARGAAGVVVQQAPQVDVPAVVVTDTWRALAALAQDARRQLAGPVVAITGSTGKTTTRALTALALSPLGHVHQTPINQNAEPGVSLTLLDCPLDAAAQVIELGAHRPGAIQALARVVEPDVRLILNVGPAHLEHLGDLDGVAHEKAALFRTARSGDIAVVPVADPRLASLPLPAGVRRVTWGPGGQVSLLEARMDPGTLTTLARWRTPSGEVDARLPSPARFVADNATAALAVAWVLGVDPVDSAGALEAYAPVGPRFRAVRLACGATVYNDCFNANPVSLPAALRVLASLPGRRAAVIGDMLELGAREAELHAQVVAAAHTLSLDLLLLVGPRMAHAAQHAPRAVVLESPQEAAEYLRGWLRDGDRVLLKASRAMRMEHALEALQI